MKKFELFTDDQTPEGFFRIRALRSFGSVKKGDVGGFAQIFDFLNESAYIALFY